MSPPAPLPGTCAVAFKEWSGVCNALATGRQSLILRKGGIAEEAGRFVPEHRYFWLYPTHVHESQQGLRLAMRVPDEAEVTGATVLVRAFAEVVSIDYAHDLETLDQLIDLHVWTAETVRKRFEYRQPGLWVLGVRVYRRERPWSVSVTPAQAGCKTWVTLEQPLATAGLEPVINQIELSRRLEVLRAAFNTGRTRKGAACDG